MNTKKNKQRLDNYLVEKGCFDNKSQAQAAIMSGDVRVNGEVITKAGTSVKENINIEIKTVPYVSRGGFKIEKAFQEFDIEVKNKICLDIGASTGGFTDFLLQNGAQKVYAVDVGYGQLAWKLRQDERVIVIERTNIRNAVGGVIYTNIDYTNHDLYANFACIDVSFISVTKILNNIKSLMNPDKQEIILLVKPQFEAGKEQVPKSGVIKDKKIHFEVIKQVADFAANIELFPINLTYSPIMGPAGNIEFLLHLSNKFECGKIDRAKFEQLISQVVKNSHENFNKG